MKTFNKVSVVVLAVCFVFVVVGLTTPAVANAAGIAPTLGAADGYSVFGKAGITDDGSATTHVWGNAGADGTNVGLAAGQVTGTIDAGAGVEAAILSAYGALNAQAADSGISLSGVTSVTPGVYTVGAALVDGTVTLNGAGVYIFRSDSSISVAVGAKVLLTNGATACNVFWQVPTAMTIGSGAEVVGTIITNTAQITLGDLATLQGRALSRNTQVTLIRNQITEPTCAIPSVGRQNGPITVVKNVINDNGGKKVISDFSLFVNGTAVASGMTNSYSTRFGTYTVTEKPDPGYKTSFSGDCDSVGRINPVPGVNKICIVTNDDIGPALVVPPVPPIINVVKVPNPLSLPGGPGLVTYTYTLTNLGTVPVSDITMVGDTCSPIVLFSGDDNSNLKLEVNETWVYKCSTTLNETHTNTVVATGWANGISAIDIASATVLVGYPLDPPIIHVTKVPSPLALLARGGVVTYTEKITNPGTVALNNVSLTDDKCSPMKYISGDTNGNSKLEPTETWTYTCTTNLTKTTTNTAVAIGDANGISVRDFALATVVVAAAVPALPGTGYGATNIFTITNIIALFSLLMLGGISYLAFLKKRTN